jgi:hypothetical protein
MGHSERNDVSAKMDHTIRKRELIQVNRRIDFMYVRFGSLADICSARRHVRFAPERWGNRPVGLIVDHENEEIHA